MTLGRPPAVAAAGGRDAWLAPARYGMIRAWLRSDCPPGRADRGTVAHLQRDGAVPRPTSSPRLPLRILATSVPLRSHLWDVVPIAWALRSAGHDVRIAVLPNIGRALAGTGLPTLVVGPRLDRARLTDLTAHPAGSPVPFVRDAAQAAGLLAHGVLGQLDYFRPQLILHEALDLAGPLVAQYLDVPAVHVSCGPPYARAGVADLRRGAVALRRRLHLDDHVRPPALVLDVCPPCYQDEPNRLDAPHQSMRFVPYNGPGAVPAWLHDPAARPRACVTAGTEGKVGAELIARIVAAVCRSARDLDVIAPMLPDPEARAAVAAAGARVVDWLPLKLLFAAGCDLVVHHGGPGTALTGLSYGLPQLVVRDPSHPAHREHSINGRLLAACGAGRSLSAAKMTDQDVTESVRQLTTDPGYGEAARAVAAEIAAQPSPAEVVPVLEELAAG